jgi:shikimate kinase
VARVLVTGMSGAGKSSVLAELERRGHQVLDTDYDGWTLPDGTWDAARMTDYLRAHPSAIVSGTVENQTQFYDRFHSVVLLTAPLDVLLDRVRSRGNNPYGKAPKDRDEIGHYVRTVEPLLRARATVGLDARRPLAELPTEIERLALGSAV